MRGRRTLLTTLFVAAVWGTASPIAPAEACGVKLLLRTSVIKPQHGVKHSSNPSRVLLLGDPPRKMVRELKQAGHQVDVAQNPEAAKSKNYNVVVASASGAADARTKFPNAKVITTNNAKQVEESVARERVAIAAARTPVNKSEERTPIGAGPTPKTPDYRRLVASKPADEPAAEPTPPPSEPKVAATPPKTEPKVAPVAPKTEPKTEPKPATAKIDTHVAVKTDVPKPADTTPGPDKSGPQKPLKNRPAAEIFFGFAGANPTGGRTAQWAAWLKQNADVSILVEGHADIVGGEVYNEWLSQKRADAVKDYLVNAGIDGSRIEVAAHGETQPKYGDGTDARNRRVMITVKK